MPPSPIYTPDNCQVAYQLNWSLSIFWQAAAPEGWLLPLKAAAEPDGVRVLEHRLVGPATSQFLVSTKPEVSAAQALRSVKGRLQYLVRTQRPKAFRRNYSVTSVGSAKGEVVQDYVAGQLGHHALADPGTQAAFERFQVHQPDVDLLAAQHSSHGLYWCNLQIVLVNEGRWREVDGSILARLRDMTVGVAAARGHRLSRAAFLPDHLHLCLGCGVDAVPVDVGLCYMNNLAYAVGMKPIFRASLYVGTFGRYDLGAVWNAVRSCQSASHPHKAGGDEG